MFREIRKGMKPFMWVIIVAFIGGIFLWGAQASLKAIFAKKANQVAKVGDYTINNEEFMYAFQREYAMRMRYMEEQYQGNIPPDVEEEIRLESANTALEMLIGEHILSNDAKNKGIVITDEEIRETILENTVFQSEGVFDNDIYETILANQLFMTPAEFEDMLRRQIVNAKLMSIFTSNIRYTDEEINKVFKRNFLTADITYIPFTLNDYLLKVDEESVDVDNYYEENKERFRKPRRAKIKYITVQIEEMAEQVNLSDSQVRDYYEEHKMEYMDAGLLHLKEILITVPEGANEGTITSAKNRAYLAINELNNGVSFEEVAKKYSDANSAGIGGDLGFIDPGMKGEIFARTAFSLEEQSYTNEPVLTEVGFFVIYRDEDIPSYQWSEDKIREKLSLDMAENMTKMKVDDVYNSLADGKPIEMVAKEMDLSLDTSDYFTEEGTIPGLGRFPEIAIKAFQLDIGEVGSVVPMYVTSIYPKPILVGYFVYIVSERVEAGVPLLEDITEVVKGDARRFRALQMAKKDALAMYKEYEESGKSFEGFISSKSLSFNSSSGITLQGGDDIIGRGYQLLKWLEDAKEGDISEPIITKKGVFIVRLDRKDDAIPDIYISTIQEVKQNLLSSLAQSIYFDYYFKRRKDVEVSANMEEFLYGTSEDEAVYQQKMKEMMEKEKEEK